VEVLDLLGRRLARLYDGPGAGLPAALPVPALTPGRYVVRVQDGLRAASAPFVVR
jgi:hypothetical protein